MICMQCGTQNFPGEKFCSNCNAKLPEFADGQKTPFPKVNERYVQFKTAGDKVKVGEWSVDDFSEFLDKMSATLTRIENEIREMEIPDESLEDFAEELEFGLGGIELYNAGIEEMRHFIDDLNSEHIDAGLQKIEDGNGKINEAIRINRENRGKLEEIYPFTSLFM